MVAIDLNAKLYEISLGIALFPKPHERRQTNNSLDPPQISTGETKLHKEQGKAGIWINFREQFFHCNHTSKLGYLWVIGKFTFMCTCHVTLVPKSSLGRIGPGC